MTEQSNLSKEACAELAVQACNVTKRFDKVEVLDNVNMNVAQACVYGLVGPNGAGKTTLLQHIAGIYRKDAGELFVFGQPVFENSAVKERIAFVPSSFYIPARATIKSMASLYASTVPRFEKDRFQVLLAGFNLPQNMPLRKFSKGMQKQTMILLALASRPDLLLLDEPMDGLDPLVRKTVWGLILANVAEFDTTVVVSSHNLRELEGICSHLGVMSQGRIVSEHDLMANENSLVKVQIAFAEGQELPELSARVAGVNILNSTAEGRLHTLIVQGEAEQIRASFASLNPVLLEIVPLSLEELFMYELKEVSSYDTSALL